MTRFEILKYLWRISVITVCDAVLAKHTRGEKLLRGDVFAIGLV